MKVKKILRSILISFILFMLLGFAAGLYWDLTDKDEEPESGARPPSNEWGSEDSSEPDSSIDPNLARYSINYVMLEENDEIEPVHTFLFSADGSYPTTYVEGQALYVSDLRGRVTRTSSDSWFGTIETGWVTDPNDSNREYEFKGWYLDPECTIPYEVGEVYEGNLTLYADINVARWIGPY